MELAEQLKATFKKAFQSLFSEDIEEDTIKLQPTKKEFEGTHTFTVFQFSKLSKKSPEETARLIGDFFVQNSGLVTSYNVVKGFLNLVIADTWLIDFLKNTSQDPYYGIFPATNEKVMVEYSSPNTNKPLHLGHLRNNFLGYALSNIFEVNGKKVIKANLINDRGIHICKSMLAYQKYGNQETPRETGKKGDKLIGEYYVLYEHKRKEEIEKLIEQGWDKEKAENENTLQSEAQELLKKWERGDPETLALWKKMNQWVIDGFNESYQRMGIAFDQYYFESDTYISGKKIVEEGLEKGVFYRKNDGSVWCDLSDEGYDEKLVLRKDGTSVYITQDLGTADIKYNDYRIDQSVYVVGNEQDYHFNVLKLILKKLDKPYAGNIFHLSYGMVDLPSGKMKSREGTVVDADELMDEMEETAKNYTHENGKIEDFDSNHARELFRILGMGALKYFLLKVDPKKRMLFNPEESVQFHGHTGPFIQYTHARISAILRKATEMGIDYENAADIHIDLLEESEHHTLIWLEKYPDAIKEAGREMAPSVIANYVYELARAYNSFYQEIPIFTNDKPDVIKFRIILSAQAGKIIKKAMGLLGIQVPDRM